MVKSVGRLILTTSIGGREGGVRSRVGKTMGPDGARTGRGLGIELSGKGAMRCTDCETAGIGTV